MPTDDDFKPKMGRGRARGRPASVGRAYLNRVTKAANLARGGAVGTMGKSKASGFHGSRIGRGAGVGSVLASRTGIEAYRQRRVIVKSRIVKLAGKGLSAATAHMRYIQRDGVTREGLPGARTWTRPMAVHSSHEPKVTGINFVSSSRPKMARSTTT